MLFRVLAFVLVLLFLTIILCEYAIYYLFLYPCSWPDIQSHIAGDDKTPIEELKIAFLADTHLLGIRKGHWFDKLRREWQMYRSFQTMLWIHRPEIVFILGDIYDEASFSVDEVYTQYLQRFRELFHVTNSTELFVVAGNHDIGFHYGMHPYLEYRFAKTMEAPSVRKISRKNIHFILINSMALEQDGCNICKKSEAEINKLSYALQCANGTIRCSKKEALKYSRPILLTHFPLFRENDANCTGWSSASGRDKYAMFKEKYDCLSQDATKYLLEKLHPRAVFTGHTHHRCITLHGYDISEYTVPSFNWRNKFNPTFIMGTFSSSYYAANICHLPNEYLVVGIYVVSFLIIFVILFKSFRKYKKMKYLKLK